MSELRCAPGQVAYIAHIAHNRWSGHVCAGSTAAHIAHNRRSPRRADMRGQKRCEQRIYAIYAIYTTLRARLRPGHNSASLLARQEDSVTSERQRETSGFSMVPRMFDRETRGRKSIG